MVGKRRCSEIQWRGAWPARSPVCLEEGSGEGEPSGTKPISPKALRTIPRYQAWAGAALHLSYPCPCPPGEGPEGRGLPPVPALAGGGGSSSPSSSVAAAVSPFPFMTNKRDCKPCMCTKCTL